MRELAECSTGHGTAPAAPRRGYPALLSNGRVGEEFLRRMVGTADAPGLVTRALGESCTKRRLQRLCEIARDGYGVEWYDGNAACRFPSWPGDVRCRGAR